MTGLGKNKGIPTKYILQACLRFTRQELISCVLQFTKQWLPSCCPDSTSKTLKHTVFYTLTHSMVHSKKHSKGPFKETYKWCLRRTYILSIQSTHKWCLRRTCNWFIRRTIAFQPPFVNLYTPSPKTCNSVGHLFSTFLLLS